MEAVQIQVGPITRDAPLSALQRVTENSTVGSQRKISDQCFTCLNRVDPNYRRTRLIHLVEAVRVLCGL